MSSSSSQLVSPALADYLAAADEATGQRIRDQLAGIDEATLLPQFFDALNALPPTARPAKADSGALGDSGGSPFVSWPAMEQFPDVVRRGKHERSAQWRDSGLRAIAAGQVAMVVLAGGQGTRLGSPLPKGMFDMSLPSGKSLFQLQAEKLRRIAAIAARHASSSSASSVAYYVLTSEATEKATRQFFAEHDYFGLAASDVMIFEQASVPVLTGDGHLLLDGPDSVAAAPNGNGGVYEALASSGALDDMGRRGVRAAMISGIDNGLLRVVDPEFMGMLLDERLDAALKVVPKAYAHERVGVLGLRRSRPSIIEYSELDPQLAAELDPRTGQLRFNTGNICIHAFSLDFLRRCGQRDVAARMPYHLAHKAVPYWDPVARRRLEPDQPNAYKLEKFVFDVFPHSDRLMAMEVSRDEEFAPLKNAAGAAADSPETARALICALHRRWIVHSGGTVADDVLVEVSPLLSYEGEDLQQIVANRHFHSSTALESN